MNMSIRTSLIKSPTHNLGKEITKFIDFNFWYSYSVGIKIELDSTENKDCERLEWLGQSKFIYQVTLFKVYRWIHRYGWTRVTIEFRNIVKTGKIRLSFLSQCTENENKMLNKGVHGILFQTSFFLVQTTNLHFLFECAEYSIIIRVKKCKAISLPIFAMRAQNLNG